MGPLSQQELVAELRRLIVRAAPDAARAAPVLGLDADEPLDLAIPFSSLIVLGAVVAIEDRFALRIPRRKLAEAVGGGATLNRLAAMVAELQAAAAAGGE
jgi:hypothetical protein